MKLLALSTRVYGKGNTPEDNSYIQIFLGVQHQTRDMINMPFKGRLLLQQGTKWQFETSTTKKLRAFDMEYIKCSKSSVSLLKWTAQGA